MQGDSMKQMNKFYRLSLVILALFAAARCGGDREKMQRPGVQADGSVLLPNSWSLTPAGEQINVGDLPLGLALSPDGRFLLVTNDGYADQYVSVIELKSRREVQKIPMERSWLGLAFNKEGSSIFVSGGGADEIEVFSFENGRADREKTIPLKAADDRKNYFAAGLAVSNDGRWLAAAALRQNCLVKCALNGNAKPVYIPVGEFPYAVIIHPDNRTAFVSNWGGKSVSIVDLRTNTESERIPVGSHPNAMRLSPDAATLYVANANSNSLSIIDIAARAVVETVDLSPYEGAPGGTTPNGLALAPDGKTLYVVNADNNDVAVVDVSDSPARIRGLIPTGWYPTAVAVTSDNATLLIANGKGLGSKPNPRGPQPVKSRTPATQYIGILFPGTVSVVAVPDAARLETYTRQVIRNNGFENMGDKLRYGVSYIEPRAIPRRIGEPSLIKYVFYIIKENRTYDQVFGDLPQGEGDSTLTLFGRDVTPNQHSLAETFVLFDNFYVDAEVSADGHEWSMGAIATDFVEKLWPTNYSGRGFPFPSGNSLEIAYPDAGYLWDAAARAGISYRSYGEFVSYGPGRSLPVQTRQQNLSGHFAPYYPPYDLSVKDSVRADVFIEEFARRYAGGTVPQLNIIRLPNDHTSGTRPGRPTPQAMVADNDLALGRIIEAISHSPVWKETAIFVVEDDSQNGPDHIDSHRTIALIASPFAKRGHVDHTMYDTVAMLKTIELILGLPPMSQYDAAAVPMFNAFQDKADLTPYRALPNTVPLNQLNTADSYGASLSMKMNFEEIDAAPEELLNEIIWKSIKGAGSDMPKPHTSRKWIDRGDEREETAGTRDKK